VHDHLAGYLQHQVFEKAGGPGAFNMVTVASVGESRGARARDGAGAGVPRRDRVRSAALMARLGITARSVTSSHRGAEIARRRDRSAIGRGAGVGCPRVAVPLVAIVNLVIELTPHTRGSALRCRCATRGDADIRPAASARWRCTPARGRSADASASVLRAGAERSAGGGRAGGGRGDGAGRPGGLVAAGAPAVICAAWRCAGSRRAYTERKRRRIGVAATVVFGALELPRWGPRSPAAR